MIGRRLVAVVVLLLAGVVLPTPSASAATAVEITVDAADVAAGNVNGLTFKGFGVLSANSTSALLLDYKAQHPEAYVRLLRVLFGGAHPVMSHVKIEMGDDRNNSTGSDPATKRWADEPANVARHPGFQLAADAKKVNPDLKVSILRWNAPKWADTNDKIYAWYKETILAAYRTYGYMVDYVNPGVNEAAADLTWTKAYAKKVLTDDVDFQPGEAELYHRIKVVISDEAGIGSFGGALTGDADLLSAVTAAGYHYNTDDDSAGNFTRLAEQYDKEVWNSEAQATFSNSAFRPNNNTADPSVAGTGLGGSGSALEMANTIVKGFVKSRRTHFIYQPAIGSFYEGGQYSYKELISARDPWSGWMHYDAGLAVLQHFSSFATTGWENDTNTAGIWRVVPQASASTATGTNPVVGRNGLPDYLTMAAPDASDFSTVLVNDSEYPATYTITPTGFDLGTDPTLAVWQTNAAAGGQAFNAGYKRHVADIAPGGTVTVAPYSIATVTSLDVSHDPEWTAPLPVEGKRTVLDADPKHGTLWADDFDYEQGFVDERGGDTGAIPLYTWDRNGSFEAVTEDGNRVLRQQVDRDVTGVGGAWNNADPITGVGDLRWTDYQTSVDVRFDREVSADNYAAIGARSTGGSASHSLAGTPYALRLGSDGGWQFLRTGSVTASGAVSAFDAAAWHHLAIRVTGADVTGFVDGTQVFAWADPKPFLSGRVDLASGFHYTSFDNLRVERVSGYPPYYSELLDNLEMTDLAQVPNTKLVYAGTWQHSNGRGMYEYQRSASITKTPGSTLTYTFSGTGLDLLGVNDGTARLTVTVDGVVTGTDLATRVSTNYQQTFGLRGLACGRHTVTVEVTSGTLLVDAAGVLGTPAR
ncbi:sugar-binding protein [Actinoplanes sp. NPDC051851]|uniref:sugar-binding protein n=1 Tax=Actinoplanes sp. NPDC051851 TaxID=3154753 RepID=UPI003417DAFA